MSDDLEYCYIEYEDRQVGTLFYKNSDYWTCAHGGWHAVISGSIVRVLGTNEIVTDSAKVHRFYQSDFEKVMGSDCVCPYSAKNYLSRFKERNYIFI